MQFFANGFCEQTCSINLQPQQNSRYTPLAREGSKNGKLNITLRSGDMAVLTKGFMVGFCPDQNLSLGEIPM